MSTEFAADQIEAAAQASRDVHTAVTEEQRRLAEVRAERDAEHDHTKKALKTTLRAVDQRHRDLSAADRERENQTRFMLGMDPLPEPDEDDPAPAPADADDNGDDADESTDGEDQGDQPQSDDPTEPSDGGDTPDEDDPAPAPADADESDDPMSWRDFLPATALGWVLALIGVVFGLWAMQTDPVQSMFTDMVRWIGIPLNFILTAAVAFALGWAGGQFGDNLDESRNRDEDS